MAKKTWLRKLHQPVHPVLAFVLICLVIIGGITALLRNYQNPTPAATPASDGATRTTFTYASPTSTPTLAPDQIKATYTFYIQATPHKTSGKGLGLNSSDAEKTFTVDIGTLIILNFGRGGKFHVSALSPQSIFANHGLAETIHLPNNAIGAFRVYRSGSGTITVYEEK